MGGNIFKNTRRYSKEEYLLVQDKWVKLLENTFQIGTIRVTNDKNTFGDLDLVVSGSKELLIKYLQNNYVYSINGNIISILDVDFQIDFITVPLECFNYSVNYFSLQDIGNILGRMLKQYGFKHGWQGLYYPQLSDIEGTKSEYVIKEHLLSLDYYKTLEIAKVDIDKFKTGFNAIEELFQWVTASPLFIPQIFKFENLNHTNRVRDKKRKTYNMFLNWLEENGWFDNNEPYKKLNKKEKRQYVLQAFPFVQKNIEEMEYQLKIHNICKSKFNGNLVKELTNLSGKELGAFMKLLKPFTTDNIIYNMNEQTIKNLILNTYTNFKKD